MMKRFLTLNDLLHEQGLSAAALAEIRTLGLAEMDSQSDWRCHKKNARRSERFASFIDLPLVAGMILCHLRPSSCSTSSSE